MAFANNRAISRPKANVQVAGGVRMLYRHPFLAGQVSDSSNIDEIDVSQNVLLNSTFLIADPSQPSSFQEFMVDGSTVTITNHLMAGRAQLPIVRTTGTVGKGDLIAAAHFIIASKDDALGTFTVIDTIGGESLITVCYGVSWENVPHYRKAGNQVVPYPVTMLYSGWVQGIGKKSVLDQKTMWAVGSKYGLKGIYAPFAIQNAEGGDFFAGRPLSAISGVDSNYTDHADGDMPAIIKVTDKGVPDIQKSTVTDMSAATWTETELTAQKEPATPSP